MAQQSQKNRIYQKQNASNPETPLSTLIANAKTIDRTRDGSNLPH
jgi:hypothetical protein